MSGHSKWATIKHKKAATYARRKVFTKLIRELTIAARTGGTDPVTNPRLRTAILTAKGGTCPMTISSAQFSAAPAIWKARRWMK